MLSKTNNKCNEKIMTAILYGYILLPFIIFLIGWIKCYIAFPMVVLLLICYYKICRESQHIWIPQINRDNFVKILFIIVVIGIWIYFSGIGKFVYQNTDHEARNGIFNILVEYEWPVINNNVIQNEITGVSKTSLVYYIGFWLPSALVGKVLGIRAGYYAQALWALLGITLVYYLICSKYKKVLVWPVVVFICFSGLDIIGVYLTGTNIFQIENTLHLEWWSTAYQYSSMTTQLFWVFNQAIPAWLCTMLAFRQSSNRNIIFILACCMITSTLPFIGLLFLVIFWCFSRKYNTKITGGNIRRIRHYVCDWIKDTFTFQNIIGGGIVGVVSFLYLLPNVAGAEKSENYLSPDMKNSLEKYIIFLIIEIGAYIIILYQYNKDNKLYYYITLILIVIPPIHVGASNDFCMRASIPALLVLICMVIDAIIKSFEEKNKLILYSLIIVLAVGSITPLHEFARTITNTNLRIGQEEKVEADDTEAEVLLSGNNFAGEAENNIFFDYLAK